MGMTEIGSDERLARVATAAQIMAKVLLERERLAAEEARVLAEPRPLNRRGHD
jgi:hypothetical protein